MTASYNLSLLGSNYNQGGSGAVARTTASKLQESVSVKDFGAVGDGTTDDTAAIQAAFNASKFRKCLLPAGKYKITSALVMDYTASYNIEGETFDPNGVSGSVIYNAGSGNAIYCANTPYVQNYDNEHRFAHLTILGTSSSGVGVYYVQKPVTMDAVWITTHGTIGIRLDKGYGSSFKNCVITQNYQHGVYVHQQGNGILFDHCIINGNSRTAGYSNVTLDGGAGYENLGVTFLGCDFTAAGIVPSNGYGMVIQYSFGVNIIGCYFENNYSGHIYADVSTNNLVVTGSYFQDGIITPVDVSGLVYEGNHHYGSGVRTTQLQASGTVTARHPTRVQNNTYAGTATSNCSAGIMEIAEIYNGSAPVSGTWAVGDVCWKSNPSAGGFVGWKCTAAGTPGTWVPFGALQNPNAYTPSNFATARSLNAGAATLSQLANTVATLITDLQTSGVLL